MEEARQANSASRSGALQSFLAFGVGRQTYGIRLDAVEQVIAAPEELISTASGRQAIGGVITFRDRVLPVVPLAAIVGLPVSDDGRGSAKIVVVVHEGNIVGLEVDRIETIRRCDRRGAAHIEARRRRCRTGRHRPLQCR
jgi:chemotaxis signal transduction protein